jgi:hypothetical protein
MSNKNEQTIVKTPHKKEEFTFDQIIELQRCMDPVLGPHYFLSNYYYIQHATRGCIQYKPFPYQIGLIDTYHNNRHAIALMGRQMGKTATAAGYLLWYAMFVPDSTILVAAHKYIGAQEIMQRIRFGYEHCPNFIRAGVPSYNKGSIDFDNGSRIMSQTTTETTGRGMAISLLYCDEFAFVPPNKAKEFWTSISPTLATGGKAIITSTPNSDEDQFSQIWRTALKTIDEYGNDIGIGRNGFKAFKAVWNEHPERDQGWENEQRASVGDERFEREHNCEFIINDETLISPMKLPTLMGIEPVDKIGQVRWYKQPKAGFTYAVALDPAIGTGGDYATIQVVELPTLIQVAEWQHNKTPVEKQISILNDITTHLCEIAGDDKVYYSLENNTLGEAHLVVIREIGEENIKGYFLSEPYRPGQQRLYRKGYNTTNKKKLVACNKFKSLVEKDKLTINSKNLISELKNFVADGTGYAAKPGENDDLVTAMLLCVSMIQQLQNFDADIDTAIKEGLDEDMEMPLPFYIGSTPFSV